MKNIKFRGYSKEYKKMLRYETLKTATKVMIDICNKHFGTRKDNSIEIKHGLFIPTFDEDMVLMQYIGINDINENEIYENDIIQVSENIGENRTYKCIVEYNAFKSRYEAREIRSDNIRYIHLIDILSSLCEVEVIGNEFENAELLEEEKHD